MKLFFYQLHFLVCFWYIICLIPKRVFSIRFNLLATTFVFSQHLVIKSVWVTEGRFISWPRWNRSEEEQLLATHVTAFSQHHQTLIPLWGPSYPLPTTHPLLPHSDLHQCTAGERKREGGMDERMDEVFWEEREDVWLSTPFGNRGGKSEVSFIVFSNIYGLHVCRCASGMKQENARGRSWMMSSNLNKSVKIYRFPVWFLSFVFLFVFIVACLHLFVSQWCQVFFK